MKLKWGKEQRERQAESGNQIVTRYGYRETRDIFAMTHDEFWEWVRWLIKDKYITGLNDLRGNGRNRYLLDLKERKNKDREKAKVPKKEKVERVVTEKVDNDALSKLINSMDLKKGMFE